MPCMLWVPEEAASLGETELPWQVSFGYSAE